MRHVPGFIVGALGTGALVAAFYAGGRVAAQSSPAADATRRPVTHLSVSNPPVMDDGPLETYQPRIVRTSYSPRAVTPARTSVRVTAPTVRPTRSWQRSAVIIGSTAAVGATVGGLTRGRKGALLGGLIGGGAATVWDQVTRRRVDDRDR